MGVPGGRGLRGKIGTTVIAKSIQYIKKRIIKERSDQLSVLLFSSSRTLDVALFSRPDHIERACGLI